MQLYLYLLTFPLAILSWFSLPDMALHGAREGRGGVDSILAGIDTLDFGLLEYDSCYLRTITISTNGPGQINLDAQLLSPSGEFSIFSPRFPVVLLPGAPVDVTIRYCPANPGRDSATLSLFGFNATNSPRIMIYGSGRGGRIDYTADSVGLASPGTCDTIAIPVANSGTIPLTITSVLPRGTQVFSHLAPALPRTLPTGATDTLFILFCPVVEGYIRDSLSVLFFDGRSREGFIEVRGRTELLTTSLMNIDYGSAITAGESRRDSFFLVGDPVRNVTLDSQWIEVDPGEDPGAFSIVRPLNLPVTISRRRFDSPFDSLQGVSVVIEFHPDGVGQYMARWWGRGEGKLIGPVSLTGNVEGSAGSGTIRFWIDTALNLPAGSRETLMVESNITGDSSQQWNTMRIGFDRKSIHVVRAIPYRESVELFPMKGNDSVITIRRQGRNAASLSDTLFMLEIVGLTTGSPVSRVPIIDVDIDDPRLTLTPGLVVLTGCDLAPGIGIGRRVMIRSINSSAASEEITILYSAPNGTTPAASLIDMNGRVVWSDRFAPASGNEQAARVDLRGFARGLYLVELRIGEDRSVTPIMIGW